MIQKDGTSVFHREAAGIHECTYNSNMKYDIKIRKDLSSLDDVKIVQKTSDIHNLYN